MSSTATPPVLAVYGATGHTGRFVVREAWRRGLPVVAVGRDAARLEDAAPRGVVRRVARIDEPDALARAFAGCAVVVNCAGPFLDTAAPVARAALRAGCHCLDVTAEQASARATFVELDGPAREAGRVVIPAAGFYGGLADLLASALAPDGELEAITVAVGLDRWWPTAGTRRTGERNKVPRVVVKGGRLVPLEPGEAPDWTFAPPLGRQAMVEVPLSEIVTLSHHLRAHEIRSLLNRSALEDLRDATTPPPAPAHEDGRSAQRFELVVQVVRAGRTRTAGARGQDIYASTAPIVIEAAARLLADPPPGGGARALAEAVDPVETLRALHGRALEVFGDALPG